MGPQAPETSPSRRESKPAVIRARRPTGLFFGLFFGDDMMKQDFRSYALVKAVALLLTVACGVAAVFSWVYCIFWWDSLFESDTTAYPVVWSRAMNDRYSGLMSLVESYDAKRRGQSLGYVEEQYYAELLSSFDPKATNFRYIIRDNDTGEILLSSAGKTSLDHIFSDTLTRHVRTISPGRVY